MRISVSIERKKYIIAEIAIIQKTSSEKPLMHKRQRVGSRMNPSE